MQGWNIANPESDMNVEGRGTLVTGTRALHRFRLALTTSCWHTLPTLAY